MVPVLVLGGWLGTVPLDSRKASPRLEPAIPLVLSEGGPSLPEADAGGAPGGAGGAPPASAAEAYYAYNPVTFQAPAGLEPAGLLRVWDNPPDTMVPDALPQQAMTAGSVAGTSGRGGHGNGQGGGTGSGIGMGTGYGTGWRLHTELPDGSIQVLLEELTALHQEAPTYPTAAINGHIQGDVLVTFTVDEKGIPIAYKITQSDNPVFNGPVLEACPKWRFAPLVMGGKRVKATFVVLFQFHFR